jgi:hypothetical protein
MAGQNVPKDYQPYSADEVAALRAKTMLNLPGTRGELIKAMRAQGIAIEDGMNH